MRSRWSLDRSEVVSTLVGMQFTIDTVLLEYDGPQVLTVRDLYGTRYLAVAADESSDGKTVRWLYAEISNLEFRAITNGGETIRDGILKDTLYVIDAVVDGGEIVNAWRVGSHDVPEDAKPDIDSFLPDDVCAPFLDTPTTPELYIGGKAIVDYAIPFSDIGALTDRLQKLWHGIAGALFYEKRPSDRTILDGVLPSTLMLAGTGQGSFALKIRPVDDIIFRSVWREYKQILDVADDEQTLRQTLAKYRPEVSDACGAYLEFLEYRKLEVLSRSERQTSFVGPTKAARVRPYFRATKSQRKPEPTTIKKSPFKVTGYFEGYSYYSKTFEFFDDKAEKRYIGKIEDTVFTQTPKSRGLQIGGSRTYVAEIRPKVTERKVDYDLLSFWEKDE